MSWYRVQIRLGALEWDIEHGDTPSPDEDEVLDNLSFGWEMPDGLWPMQPPPMRAALALNVPDFTTAIADLVEGDEVAIKVYVVEGSEETGDFQFFGRITDLKATPRTRRTGVTLSVAAVDYTVDLGELGQYAPVAGSWTTESILTDMWSTFSLGTFPDWPTEYGTHPIDPSLDVSPVPDLIEHELRQTIGLTGSYAVAPSRMILAPNIDFATGALDATQPWVFDRVSREPLEEAFTIQSCYIETQSIEWLYAKNGGPNVVEVIGDAVSAGAAHGGITHRRYERVEVTLTDSGDAQDVADFYLPDNAPSVWRIERCRLLLSRMGEDITTIPTTTLFPRWDDTPPSDFRAICYGRRVEISDYPGHQNPFAADADDTSASVGGRICAASVVVAGGHVSIDMQLRQTTYL